MRRVVPTLAVSLLVVFAVGCSFLRPGGVETSSSGGAAGTTAETPKAVAKANLSVERDSSFYAWRVDWPTVVGWVRNDGPGSAGSIHVTVIGYSPQGSVVDTTSGSLQGATLAPGESAPFRADLTAKRGQIARYGYDVRWANLDHDPVPLRPRAKITASKGKPSRLSDGVPVYIVDGTVTREIGDWPGAKNDILVTAVGYDASGKAIAFGVIENPTEPKSWVQFDSGTDTTGTFHIWLNTSDPNKIKRYELHISQ